MEGRAGAVFAQPSVRTEMAHENTGGKGRTSLDIDGRTKAGGTKRQNSLLHCEGFDLSVREHVEQVEPGGEVVRVRYCVSRVCRIQKAVRVVAET